MISKLALVEVLVKKNKKVQITQQNLLRRGVISVANWVLITKEVCEIELFDTVLLLLRRNLSVNNKIETFS